MSNANNYQSSQNYQKMSGNYISKSNTNDHNSSSNTHKKYYPSQKGPYESKYQNKYYNNPSNSNQSTYPNKQNFFSQDPSVYYKNNLYQSLGKSGYLSQNPLKPLDSSAISNLPLFSKSKNFSNGPLEPSDQSNDNKNPILGVKRKSIGGLDEYESVYMKKMKPENFGPDERKFSRNSSDFAWIENDSGQSVIEENSYLPEDLPEISNKIAKMIEEIKIDVTSDDLENNFMTSYSLSTLNPKLDYIGDNPAITEKTIKIYKDKLQTKPDAFDAYGPKSNENEMSIEMPTRILTIPRSLINLKEYEELIENVEEELKSKSKIINEENKNIIKFRYLYDKTKIQYKSLLDNINI